MSKVYIIKHETDFGPFFSSKEKVIAYLKDPDRITQTWTTRQGSTRFWKVAILTLTYLK